MKFHLLPILGVLAMASAHGQTVKPGTINPLLFEASITTENAPTQVNLPNGAKRKTYTTSTVRFLNRDILEAMRVASLLDGTIVGWSLNRVASPNGVGNIYALKNGKTAVAVPANLLTQPVNQGTATTGNEIVPATGATKPNLVRKAYATISVRNGAGSAAGTQTLKFATVGSGSSATIVATQMDNFAVTGKSGTGTGIVSGNYRTQRTLLANLTPFFPGATVP
ncbi:hypothetical protein [Luteolibacter luteus]|uniref:Uncharacterized protein n=1 Tax=Luteolibacter luteus TaxID=2728835 RepID=A0A858RFN4_9BACT|nr:hypothetical protein [Luteolibacter luteus]QJE95411.1 hypothetical protein HHL09_06325 [Luteolibacter luteus]